MSETRLTVESEMRVSAKKMGSNLPTSAPDGAIMVSAGKYARSAVMTAFEMIGGVERMAQWADENPGDFYTKLFSKTITKEVETTETQSVEDLLDVIDAEAVEVEDGNS